MKISCMEWNINGRGGAKGVEFPSFIADKIHSENPDVVILVEFFQRTGWEDFRDKLSKDYILCLSEDYGSSKNQVLIAVLKNLNPVIENIKSHISRGRQLLEIPGLEYLHPEFLQVDMTIERDGERKRLSVIGTRIKTQDENTIYYNRRKQFELLVSHISGIPHPFVVTGDFNNGRLQAKYTRADAVQYNYALMQSIVDNSSCFIHTPTAGDSWRIFRDTNGKWGCGFNHNEKSKKVDRFAIDHFITNCTYISGSSKYDFSSFVDSPNWYCVENCEFENTPQYPKYLPKAGLPDHAYLYGEFEL